MLNKDFTAKNNVVGKGNLGFTAIYNSVLYGSLGFSFTMFSTTFHLSTDFTARAHHDMNQTQIPNVGK